MVAALAGAFVVGHEVFQNHWIWPVLTAFVVSSGNRGRGDVVYKGALRLAGALAGTVVASAMFINLFGTGSSAAVVAIFILITIGSWLRPLNYAYWAGCVTAVLAFLYGFFGQGAASLLQTRLEGILCGGVLAIAASWFILPLKTSDVVRRRGSEALAALTDVLVAVRDEPAHLACCEVRFVNALRQIDRVVEPLAVYGRLTRQWQYEPRLADTVAPIRRCAEPIQTIVQSAALCPEALQQPRVAHLATVGLDHLVGLRRAMADHGAPPPVPIRAAVSETVDAAASSPSVRVADALDQIRAAVCTLAAIYAETLPTSIASNAVGEDRRGSPRAKEGGYSSGSSEANGSRNNSATG
jgi:uncharacterized membrane protein YccC